MNKLWLSFCMIFSAGNLLAQNPLALDALKQGQDYLNNHYDYTAAINAFSQASTLCEQELSSTVHDDAAQEYTARAWIGLAMSYHMVGNFTSRDVYMQKAQTLLGITQDAATYTDITKFTESASDYFGVDGYRFYWHYALLQRSGGPLDQKEAYLLAAKASFLKSLEIQKTLHIPTHALQGLGTTFEFLSECAQSRGDLATAEQYAQQSVDSFAQALSERKRLLGDHHPHVARSLHKLARNYVKLALVTQSCNGATTKAALYRNADVCYAAALDIFEKNNIPADHPKRKELQEDYDAFKKNFCSQEGIPL